MRDDLLDAHTTVDWAETQIPLMQERFVEWQRRRPYRIVEENDPQTGDKLIVAHNDPLLSLDFNAEIGAIINTIRSSLDLLAAALAKRNGIKPSKHTHFPIFKWKRDFILAVKHIKAKKWLSRSELAAIKRLRPYKRGDKFLYPLKELDNTRKHERLISLNTISSGNFIMGLEIGVGSPEWQRFKDKTVIYRLPGNYPPLPEGNVHLMFEILFDESAIGVGNKPAIRVLKAFIDRAREIISLFDKP